MDFTDADLAAIDIYRLPHTMRKIIMAIGLKSTIKIIRSHGGTQLRIANDTNKVKVINQFLSPKEVNNLVDVLGGQRINVPKIDKITNQVRNFKIIKDKNLMTIGDLAIKYSLTRKSIFNILKNSH